MRRTRPTESLLYNVRSWADNVPLGSLDQLQQAAGRSHLLRGDADNPSSIPLAASSESCLQDTGSRDVLSAQTSGHSVLDAQDQLQLNIAEAIDAPLPEPSVLGNESRSSGLVSTVDSFAQLQTARISALGRLHQLDTAEAIDVLLPESSGLGNGRCSSGRVSTVDSLAQLQTARTSAPAEHSTEQPTHSLTGQDYWENIRPLAQILPHLKAIQPSNARHKCVGRLKSIDYFKDGRAPQYGIYYEMGVHHDELVIELQNVKQVHDDVASRMVIVEDLCPELIGALGLAFDLDPEFFAEHLNRSGYDHLDYEDSPPARWNTAQLQKDHVSMTWMRPVYQSMKVAELLQTPGAILDPPKKSPGSKEVTAKNTVVWRDAEFNAKGERNGQAMEHTPLVATNIFRQSWPLGTHPVARADLQGVEDDAQPGLAPQTRPNSTSDQKLDELLPAAWEERVSFCYHGEDTRMPIGMWHIRVLVHRDETPLSRSRYHFG
jgi:hypothetical protein